MKPSILISLLAMLLGGCGSDSFYYPNGRLMARFQSDRTGWAFTGPGFTCTSPTALHSTVAREHWHGADRLANIVATDALSAYGLSVGSAAVKAASLIPPAVTTYKTTSATPTPTPVAKGIHP